MKRVPIVVVVVFLGIATGACRERNVTGPAPGPAGPPAPTSAAGANTRPLRIAMIAKSASNPSFVAARTGAENRARELSASLARPIQVEWLTPPQEDGAVQAQRIAQAVKEGMDAVLLSCSDARTATPAIDDAVAHGVPVMTFDSDAPESKRFAYCGVDDVKAGEMIMEELARLVPRGAHVAVLAGNRAAPNLSRRVEGVLR
ncbi:MAG TPA: substrate-binding domain-containing protein, partial [Polyangia bacterium]|nr:substrate-binding domain-containing protein [Polyangia bacterium]